jgi:hypothetical protein
MKIPLQDFEPDSDPTKKGIILDANWVWRSPAGWRGLEVPTPSSPVLPNGPALGGFMANFGTAGVLVFIANANQIYQWTMLGPLALVSPTYNNLNNSWVFDTYGNDIIAVNGTDPPQVFTQGSSIAFAPLAGNPPVSSIVAATDYGVFLITGNAWLFSANDTLWTPGIENEVVGDVITATPGSITAAKGLRGGIAMYKQTAVHYGLFTGPPNFWQINNYSEVVGTPSAHSVIPYRDVHYFVGPDDFYTFDGWSVQPIPNNLRTWFFHTNLDRLYAANIRGAANPSRNQLVWFYPSINANPRGSLDSAISLSTVTGLWAPSSVKADLPLEGYEPLDGPSPLVGQMGLAYVDSNHILQLLLEPTGEAPIPGRPISYITSGDLGDKVNLYKITRVCPGFLNMPSTMPMSGLSTLQVWSQYVLGQAAGLQQGPKSVFSVSGFFDLVTANRLQRLQITLLPRMTITDMDVEMAFAGRQ